MKKLLLLVVALSALFQSCQNDSTQPNSDMTSQINAFPKESLSADEISSLNYMREEEKLAHDVYTTLSSKWNIPIFSNISSSEMTHSSAVLTVLNKYSLPDPASNKPVGVFADSILQKLYTQLVLAGNTSLLDAYKTGATIEDVDIYDLKNWELKTDNQDIRFVYDNLTKGSRNHLRSFYDQVKSSGGSYSAQFITQAEFDAIINSPKETGAW